MLEAVLGRNRNPWSSVPWVLFAGATLSLLGILMLWSVTTVYGDDPYSHVLRQSVFLGLAVAAMLAVSAVGHRLLAAWSRPLLVATWCLLILVLMMPHQLGASRWITIGRINIQPSELAKPVMILMLSAFCAARTHCRRRMRDVYLPACAYVAFTAVLVLMEPDLGQTLFILGLSLVVLLVNGLRLGHVIGASLVLMPALVLLMMNRFEYVQKRLDSFTSEVADYQVHQGLITLASGGLTGLGVGSGRAHLLFVPKIHNDFVMIAIGEQFGFLGCLVVILLFGLILFHGLRIAFRARDTLGFSIAFGVTFMITLQAAVNLAVVTNSIPPKGISLPFVSYGGSSLVVLGASLGLLVSVAREAREHGSGRVERRSRTHPAGSSRRLITPDNSRKKQLDTPSTPSLDSRSGASTFKGAGRRRRRAAVETGAASSAVPTREATEGG